LSQTGSRGLWLLLVLVVVAVGCGKPIQVMPVPSPPVTRSVTISPQPTFCTIPWETGIAYPQWNSSGYGANDTVWRSEVATLKAQTNSCWIEMPVLFTQMSNSSTSMQAESNAPTPAALTAGVEYAHSLGLKVFVTFLMSVKQPGGWAGSIRFSNLLDEMAWFANYWKAIAPYTQAAEVSMVDQLAFGVEEQWLQTFASPNLWNQLISAVSHVYSRQLVYDMNWSASGVVLQDWMRNKSLTTIGVDAYWPLTSYKRKLSMADITSQWLAIVKPQLDSLSRQLGREIIIGEMGFRDDEFAGYATWQSSNSGRKDPQEQSWLFDVAIAELRADTHVAGVFLWGWQDTGAFDLKGSVAVATIATRYS